MALTYEPPFLQTANNYPARISAANTARDGSGSIVTVMTAGANGSRVDSVTFTSAQATAAANSAMVGRVFISDNAGANWRLKAEVAITSVTASNTAIGATQTITFYPALTLKSGQLLGATISVYAGAQDQMDVSYSGGDY